MNEERTRETGNEVRLWANRKRKVQTLAVVLVLLLLPVFFALLAHFNEGDLRTAYWIACAVSFVVIVWLSFEILKPEFRAFRHPAAVLKEDFIAGADGVEIPVRLIKEIVLVKAFGRPVIGFPMKPGAFDQMEGEWVKRIKERPDWFMSKFGLALCYHGFTIPGDRVVELIAQKYGLTVRKRKKDIDM